MNSQLLLAFLRLPEDTSIPEESFSETCGLPEGKTSRGLREASQLGLVQITNGYLRVTRWERIQLVLRCLEEGLDLENVCKAAGWREFEDLAAMILGSNDYATKKHLRFRSDERRYEVDILALKVPWSLVVECKRWKRSWQPSALRKVAGLHKHRSLALSEALPSLHDKLDYDAHKGMKLVPVILMLSEAPMKIEDGVPFVPVRKFQSFLEEFAGYIEELEVYVCPPRGSP